MVDLYNLILMPQHNPNLTREYELPPLIYTFLIKREFAPTHELIFSIYMIVNSIWESDRLLFAVILKYIIVKGLIS